ncbi:hypothetical protein [Pseudomonas citronellolis]|uniref:hypothetical protein n=1 Tax=Pseudomonas citronellolis TaxID=53408 RepID=UPI000778A8C1|nr:hypothetical protein [Pseudomonas citronellolis]AMO76054.1 hypothetical protein PcP3B5_26190 [Pseudomonas citronellolis]
MSKVFSLAVPRTGRHLPGLMEAGYLLAGLLAGRLFAQSPLGLAGLVLLGMLLAWLLVQRAAPGRRQLAGVLYFCAGVAACSAKLAEIIGIYQQGQPYLALRELPELFICVVLPPFMAMTLVMLVHLVLND